MCRLLCSACEDVGSANFNAIVVVKSLVDTAIQLGYPECRLPLSEAVVYLTLQPKSNKCYLAIEEAMKDVNVEEVPNHLKDSHYSNDFSVRNEKLFMSKKSVKFSTASN